LKQKQETRSIDMTDPKYSRVPQGVYLVKDPVEYNGVSTPTEERAHLGIQGLVPTAYIPLELDVQRCMEQLRSKSTPLEQYTYLASIQDVSERLYFAMLVKHTDETMPIVYTPTVGAACENFSKVYRGTLRGMYFSLKDAGNIRKILDNWPSQNVTTIVVTDGGFFSHCEGVRTIVFDSHMSSLQLIL
jgi:malate dehydrogenase (oxaloacetate-decarboxylating)(NADP+)